MNPRKIYQLKIVLGVVMLSGAYGAGSGRFDLWPRWCYAGFSLVTLAASYLIASDTVRLRELSVSAAILLAVYSASAQSKDVAGAKDPALFNRMPHYTITDYHESQFDGSSVTEHSPFVEVTSRPLLTTKT